MQDHKKLKRRVRNSYIISTVSIAMVLFLLGTVSFLILNALMATDRLRESVAVYVMLEDGLTEDQIARVGDRLDDIDAVKQIVYLSKEKEAEEFSRYLQTDFNEFLDFNPLKNSYELRLNAADVSSGVIEKLVQELESWREVHEIIYQGGMIDRMDRNINKVNFVLMLFGAALLMISLVLLNNTIRVTIFSKRYIISTMKLVGATKWFVMKPFLKTSILQGIYSALIATIMFAAIIYGINDGIPELNFIKGNILLVWIVAGMFVVGVLISLLFTIFAVNKFVKMHTDSVHLY